MIFALKKFHPSDSLPLFVAIGSEFLEAEKGLCPHQDVSCISLYTPKNMKIKGRVPKAWCDSLPIWRLAVECSQMVSRGTLTPLIFLLDWFNPNFSATVCSHWLLRRGSFPTRILPVFCRWVFPGIWCSVGGEWLLRGSKACGVLDPNPCFVLAHIRIC